MKWDVKSYCPHTSAHLINATALPCSGGLVESRETNNDNSIILQFFYCENVYYFSFKVRNFSFDVKQIFLNNCIHYVASSDLELIYFGKWRSFVYCLGLLICMYQWVGMWWSSNLNLMTFKLRTFSPDSKFDECFKRFVVECEFVEKSLFYDWFHMHTARERRQTSFFFSNSTYHENYSNIWMSNIVSVQWCVTLYYYEHWLCWL